MYTAYCPKSQQRLPNIPQQNPNVGWVTDRNPHCSKTVLEMSPTQALAMTHGHASSIGMVKANKVERKIDNHNYIRNKAQPTTAWRGANTERQKWKKGNKGRANPKGCICVKVCIYIHIYIERERERDRDMYRRELSCKLRLMTLVSPMQEQKKPANAACL